MNPKQFHILASKMKAGALKDAAYLVLVKKERQCDAARLHDVSKQNLSQAIKRLENRQRQFDAMGKAA